MSNVVGSDILKVAPHTGHLIRTYTGDAVPGYTPATGEAVTDIRYIYDDLRRLE